MPRSVSGWHGRAPWRGRVAACAGAVLLLTGPAFAADWPQFRGPNRDGKSAETGLLESWPEGGPRLLLTLGDLGDGFSSPVIAAGRIFVTGKVKDDCRVFSFDLEGRRLWQSKAGPEFTGFWPAARSTPTFDDGMVYVLTGAGRLAALDAATGQEAWGFNIFEAFRSKRPFYGVAESVLVAGPHVICTPGGSDTCIMAIDKKTGYTVWTSRGIGAEAGYASPILADWQGIRQIITLTDGGLVGVRADNGTVLWSFDKYFPKEPARKILTPIFRDGYVFADGGHLCKGGTVRLEIVGSAVTATGVWEKPQRATHLGGYVERDSLLFGHDGQGWACTEMLTGIVRYKSKEIAPAATLWADGRFYCLGESGKMHLVEADARACRIVSSFKIPSAGPQTWAYPAISDGKLFIRRADKVFMYDIRR